MLAGGRGPDTSAHAEPALKPAQADLAVGGDPTVGDSATCGSIRPGRTRVEVRPRAVVQVRRRGIDPMENGYSCR